MIASYANLMLQTSMAVNISMLACFMIFTIAKAGDSRFETYGEKLNLLFYIGCALPVTAFGLLIYGFIISDFTLQNVFLNSSTIKPLIYKISASWASHEGSILLWFAMLNVIAAIAKPIEGEFGKFYVIISSILQLAFGSYIYFTSSPFVSLSFRPEQGLGLNPMLQDIALAIHPPLLYLGYVCYLPPFIYGCTMLLKNDNELQKLLISAKYFVNIGMLFLTSGVSIGSWWAYRELGWGGFWFFDPVENLSLIPWLCGIALHHSLMTTIKSMRLMSWSISLCILTFLQIILSVFLVRSGMLESIHAFASSPSRAIYFLAIFALCAVPSLTLLLTQSTKIKANNTLTFKEYGLAAGNINWQIIAVILLTATLYPIIYSVIYGQNISISEAYFTKIFVPSFVPIFFLAAIFCSKTPNRHHISVVIISLSATAIIGYYIKYKFLPLLMIFAANFLITHTIDVLLTKSKFFTSKVSPVLAAMSFSHFGFGAIALAIILNTHLQKEVDFIGKIGDVVKSDNFEITLKDVRFSEYQNYYRQITEFWVSTTENGKVSGNITILKPENRLYKIEQRLSQESDIFSYLFYDLYAVLSKIEGSIIHAKIYYRPAISFIWLSAALIACGFLISWINAKRKI